MKNIYFILIIFIFFLLNFSSCSDGGSSSNSGTLSLDLTDAASDDYKAVYVTIKEVKVNKKDDEDSENGWKTVATPDKTYNLLELVNGVREELGITSLSPGAYSQMRMILGTEPDDEDNILFQPHECANYIIGKDDEVHELKVPSGEQTGIKIVCGFEINANSTTELILDFDASRSVVKAGNSGKWLLKPVVKVSDEALNSVITGVIEESEGEGEKIEGAFVSVQTYDGEEEDPKDRVTVYTTTLSSEDDNDCGQYKLFVPSGDYNIVVYKEGYEISCARVSVEAGNEYTQDFSLVDSETCTISGEVSVGDDPEDEDLYVTISFRQLMTCGIEDDQMVEIKSVNVGNGSEYSINLPTDVSLVVASSYEEETQEFVDLTDYKNGQPLDIDM